MKMKMKNEDFKAIGQYLYGEKWQSPLARKLNVNIRTLQRWTSGDYHITDWVCDEVFEMAAQKQLLEILPIIESFLEKYGNDSEIELKVYGNDDKITSIHSRPWSHDCDEKIKNKIAEELKIMEINAFVAKM